MKFSWRMEISSDTLDWEVEVGVLDKASKVFRGLQKEAQAEEKSGRLQTEIRIRAHHLDLGGESEIPTFPCFPTNEKPHWKIWGSPSRADKGLCTATKSSRVD